MKHFTFLNIMQIVKISILTPFSSNLADCAEIVRLKGAEKTSVSLCKGRPQKKNVI